MAMIGILGGMSAASTALYYEALDRGARARLGGLHGADLLIRSVDFARIEALQRAGDWDSAGRLLAGEAARLEAAGAALVILATNTMHKVAGRIEAALGVPFLHIADATAAELLAAGHSRPGLMATRYTMEEDFYTGRLRAAGLSPVIPDAGDRAEIHRIIFDELCRGETRAASRAIFEGVAARLAAAGADSLVLGCTEIGMLLGPGNSPLPVHDTTLIHVRRALDAALAPGMDGGFAALGDRVSERT